MFKKITIWFKSLFRRKNFLSEDEEKELKEIKKKAFLDKARYLIAKQGEEEALKSYGKKEVKNGWNI